MFAPDQVRTAAELLRVCKPEGRIGMANWVPAGFVGQMFATTVKHAPPPPGVQPPVLWAWRTTFAGSSATGSRSCEWSPSSCRCATRAPTPGSAGYFKMWFGPMKMAFARVGPEGETALTADLRELVERFNRGEGGAMVVPSEYAEVELAVRA